MSAYNTEPDIVFNPSNKEESRIYAANRNLQGDLSDSYAPFNNLILHSGKLTEMSTNKLNFQHEPVTTPVELEIQPFFDGSVNVVLSDDVNSVKLINSRFSVQEGKTYEIVDHKGEKDRNLYEEDKFEQQSALLPSYEGIPKLEFVKLLETGSLKCGSYFFYFSLLDNEDNETEIVQESNLVQLFIGDIGTPYIRMGMQDEISNKSVVFNLSNIHSGYNFVKVYFERSTSDNTQVAHTSYHSINYKFPIKEGTCDITITGSEDIVEIDKADFLKDFANIGTAKTICQSQNRLFLGNTTQDRTRYNDLQSLSWRITPSVDIKSGKIGSVIEKDYSFERSLDDTTKGAYYNTYNTYYSTGYWADEFYRFGIYYIFENGQVSPVFNIQGINLQTIPNPDNNPGANQLGGFSVSDQNVTVNNLSIPEPDNFYFNKKYFINSKGVVRLPKANIHQLNVSVGNLQPTIIGVKFNIPASVSEILKNHFNVKGYGIVRQKRIPTILAQGLVIGKSDVDKTGIPVMMSGLYGSCKGFLEQSRTLGDNPKTITGIKASPKAMLVPEAAVRKSTLGQLFNGSTYYLEQVARANLQYNTSSLIVAQGVVNEQITKASSNLIFMDENIAAKKIKDELFSTKAGTAEEAYTCMDVKHDWKVTAPQDLTTSSDKVRGLFTPFVGLTSEAFQQGQILNIKVPSSEKEDFNDLQFLQRFSDLSPFYSISTRQPIDNNTDVFYGGDCFICNVTTRLQRNFTDPELPNVQEVVNPMCWAENYIVRNTLSRKQTANNFLSLFNSGGTDTFYEKDDSEKLRANEVVQAFSVNINGDMQENSNYKALDPQSQESSSSGGTLKKIFGSIISTVKEEEWVTRGLSNINRADVNAVPIGTWITFPVCCSINLSLRDIDYNHPEEEVIFGKKRDFFPFSNNLDAHSTQQDSDVINGACAISVPSKKYLQLPDVPFFKEEYNTRIWWSEISVNNSIKNGYRVIYESAYRDYPKIYGSITKIVDYNGNIVCVCEHGILFLTVNERAMTSATEGGPIYIGSNSVLPETPVVVSDMYGSMWKDSVIKTESGIFGVDTVAKKIWLYNGELTCISDFKVQKFLNDHLDLSEFDMQEDLGKKNVVTHYNAFKRDVIFTFYNNDRNIKWSLCYNLVTQKFTTFYDWYPVLSQNIDNIFFSFDRDKFLKIQDSLNQKLNDGFTPYNAILQVYPNAIKGEGTYQELKSNIDGAYTGFTNVYTYEVDDASDTYSDTDYKYVVVLGTSRPSTEPLKDMGLTDDSIACLSFYIKTTNDVDLVLNGEYEKKDFVFEGDTVEVQNNIAKGSSNDDAWRFFSIYFKYSTLKKGSYITIASKQAEQLELCEPHFTEIKEDFEIYNKINNKLKTIDYYTQLTDESDPISDGDHAPYEIRTASDFMELWKHGQAGLYDNQGKIKPANWYGKQHEFNFEFIVNESPQIQKIFNNLMILSNKAEPKKFEFEVVGESYEWWEYKEVIEWINSKAETLPGNYEENLKYLYKYVLESTYGELLKQDDFPALFGKDASYKFPKIPYFVEFTEFEKAQVENDIKERALETGSNDFEYLNNCVETCLIEDTQLHENRVHTEQLGVDIKKYGRAAGNMQYLEDLWRVELRPVRFSYALLKDNTQQRFKAREKESSQAEVTVDEGIMQLKKLTGITSTTFKLYGKFKKGILYSFETLSNNDCYVYFDNIEEPQFVEKGLNKIYFSVSENCSIVEMTVLADNSESEIIFRQPTEDIWVITAGDVNFTAPIEARLRDKYLKVKVRYSGENLAIIQGVTTLFDYSFA